MPRDKNLRKYSMAREERNGKHRSAPTAGIPRQILIGESDCFLCSIAHCYIMVLCLRKGSPYKKQHIQPVPIELTR